MSIKLLTYDVYRTGMTTFKELADATYQSKEKLPTYALAKTTSSALVPAGYDVAYAIMKVDYDDLPPEYDLLHPPYEPNKVAGEIIGVKGGKGGGILNVYLNANAAPYSYNWLKEEEDSAQPLIPTTEFLYLILTPGIYYHTLVMFVPNLQPSAGYVNVMDATDLRFVYTIDGKTPFSSDWLSFEANGTPITPQTDKLYIILSANKYQNFLLRYNGSGYVLLSGGGSGGGATFSYIVSGSTAFSAGWLSESAGGAALEPEEGSLYLVRTAGQYENIFYRFDATANKYIEVIRCPIASIAPAFNSSNNYSAGALCSYENQLWKFNADHTGAWTGSDAITTNLAAELVSGLSAIQTSVNTQIAGISGTVDGKLDTLHTTITGETNTAIASVRSDLKVQFATLPEASETYADKVYQYIGTTNANYIYGHWYKCQQVSGTYTWVPMGDRNTVKFAGTALADRSGLNFIDFDLSDDNAADETKIKPHELSTDEWEEIFAVKPAFPTIGLCIDLSGAEYVVGNYMQANGTSKVIYCRTISGTTISSGTYGTIATGLTNISLCWIESFVVYGTNYTKNLISDVSISSNGANIYMVADTDSIYRNKSFVAVVYYTKEVD